MNKAIYRRWLQALMLVLLLAPSLANAVGMGRLTVLSLLGQPFNAEVDLVSVQNEELSTLSARLASVDAYRQANRQYDAVVAGLRFHIEKRPDGQPYIKITSERAVNDPFVDLLMELNWASGRLVREYTALIDPPPLAPAQSLVPALTGAPETRTRPQPAVAAATPPSMAPAGGGEYGPIKRSQTLSRIAASVKPKGVSLEQMLVGIFRNNPDAFMNNNMNRLKVGKMLRIPNREQLLAMPQSDAAREVRAQVTDRSKYRRKAVASPRVKDKTTDGKPVLRLSSGEPSGSAKRRSQDDRVRALEEELIEHERVLKESNQRTKELKGSVKQPAQ